MSSQPKNLNNKEAMTYLNKYPDLKIAFGNNIKKAQEHWNNCGFKEGRKIYDNNIKMNEIEELKNIHSKLHIKYGSFNEELVEQKMSYLYLNKNDKVLELGGNIGRNSMIISYILDNNQHNLVTLESDEEIANKLTENKHLNNMRFHIESSALSKRPLIQKGWDTIVSDTLIDGYKKVKTITLEELKEKYNIQFNTLVIDCEGAFYYILVDMPEILNGINKILMENDYLDLNHKIYIDNVLKNNGFNVVFSESEQNYWKRDNFWEVWIR